MILERSRIGRQIRLHAGATHAFELKALVEALRDERTYAEFGKDGVTLVKTAELRVILEVLSPGTGLSAHHDPGPATLQLLEGELRFEVDAQVMYLRAGEVLTMLTHRPHTLEAVEECAFLLTIATGAGPQVQPDAPATPEPASRRGAGWPAVQERYPESWPVEVGDEQC